MARPTIADQFGDSHWGHGELLKNDIQDQLLAQHNEHAAALDALEAEVGAGLVDGTGTANTLAKFTAPNTIADSAVSDNGGVVAINERDLNISRSTANSVTKVEIQNDARLWELKTDGNNNDDFYLYDATGTRTTLIAASADGEVTLPNNVTLGDASTDTVTIDGHVAVGTTPNTDRAINVLYNGRDYGVYSSHTANNVADSRQGGGFFASGSYDTTAAGRTAIGVVAEAAGSRSVGANNLTNYGLYVNAASGQVNYAIYSPNGDVHLNDISGTTRIDGATTLNSTLTVNDVTQINGDLTVTGSIAGGISDANSHVLIGTVTAQKTDTNSDALVQLQNDARLWQLLNEGSNSDRFAIKDSTGGVTVLHATVNGGMVTVPGNTTLGTDGTNTHLTNGDLVIREGTPTASAAIAGTVLALEQTDGTANYLSFRGNTTAGIRVANSVSSGDGQLVYSSGAFPRGWAFTAAGTVRTAITSTGAVQMGDIGANVAVDSNVDVLTIGNAGTGQTSDTDLIDLSHTGSFNATAAARTYTGLRSVLSATRSAGANDVIAAAVLAQASGAQVNWAIKANTGGDIGLAGATDKVGFYGATPVVRGTVTALTDNSGGTANDTVQALTDPADTPISSDALRDDLVANLIPELRNNFADLAGKINSLRTALVNLGLIT